MKWLRNLIFGPMRELRPYYLSWYKPPLATRTEWLCKDPEGGWFYSQDIDQAHEFETYASAWAVTPIYDGTSDIEKRRGVTRVPYR
jgi:hypothetical protein